jgi:ubiquinone/menaquinone biosynthesis C-methylase UbiE
MAESLKAAVGGAMAESDIHNKWVSTYRTAEAQAFYELAFDEIVRRLNAPKDATILDAGCGSCAKSVLLAKRGFRVMGSDFSQRALDLAANTVREHGVADRISLQREDLTDLSFPNDQFKYAICWGVLMHVPHVQKALSELSRVLAPGGQLVLSEGNMYSLQAVTLRVLRRLLRKGQATVVRTPAGMEAHEDTSQGKLLTRETDMSWLVAEADRLGLRLKARVAGQFTELYVIAPGRPAKRMIHTLNRFWFRHVGAAGPAFANILIFEKQ